MEKGLKKNTYCGSALFSCSAILAFLLDSIKPYLTINRRYFGTNKTPEPSSISSFYRPKENWKKTGMDSDHGRRKSTFRYPYTSSHTSWGSVFCSQDVLSFGVTECLGNVFVDLLAERDFGPCKTGDWYLKTNWWILQIIYWYENWLIRSNS